MTAILRGEKQLEALPAVAKWLHFADAARQVVAERHAMKDDVAKLDALVRENVLAQLDNLLTHPVVANAVKAKEIRLHGWVFDIPTARVMTYDALKEEFIPLAHSSFAGVSS